MESGKPVEIFDGLLVGDEEGRAEGAFRSAGFAPNLKRQRTATMMEPSSSGDNDFSRSNVHVEVAIHQNCLKPPDEIRQEWLGFLHNDASFDGLQIQKISDVLRNQCRSVAVISPTGIIPQNAKFHVHAYHLSNEESCLEELEPDGNGGGDFTAACDNLTVPHVSLDGLWESLIFDANIKGTLLQYAQSALLFSEKKVSGNLINWNRMILLHGPAGTGKTSLCRALAHKLGIRLSHKFTGAQLLEIHSHSLFSRWFSTSGKLISRLFELVRDMIQDEPRSLICVLVDEVESLAASRGASEGDPADAMRAVNALLTSLDKLKVHPNVLVLATTNLTKKVDSAFLDRADLKLYIGNPNMDARTSILRSAVMELVRVGVLEQDVDASIQDLSALSLATEGLSGRSLRRLPLQAHTMLGCTGGAAPVSDFLQALKQAAAAELASEAELKSKAA